MAAIIAAGGRGLRLGAAAPKQFLPLGGQTMLEMSVGAFTSHAAINEVVVAVPADFVADVRSALSASSVALNKSVAVVEGGGRRQDSVANAFARVSARADVVLIHDAARPFVTPGLIDRMIAAGDKHGAAIAAMPVSDTVKRAAAGPNGERPISATLPREEIFLAQTPQAFRRHVLERAIRDGGADDATDEAALAERAGVPVHIVEGDPGNIKITTPGDLATAQAIALQESPDRFLEDEGFSPRLRIGTGYDLHRLVAGRPLILAGVRIPFELGLDGHSDADIVCHAVTDAILGAVAAGDIGRLFPDTDPKWKDADSIAMLKGALAHIVAKGYRVSNVDVTVIAQKPKLLPHLDRMRGNLASALQVDTSAISIKGKTNEGVDSMGRGESMACHAVALITT